MKRKFSTDHLPFSVLALDPEYQRETINARVKHLVSNWRLEDVGAITVSIRTGDPKKAYIIDGQHRYRAAMELGLNDTKVLCHVYRGLSREEEARKFLAANDSRAVTPFDKYRAGLISGDAIAIGTRNVAEENGWRITGASGDGQIACVGQLMKLYERNPDLLKDTLKVVTETWGTKAGAVEAPILGGMAIILDRFNGELDRGALAKKLAKSGGATTLLGDAKQYSEYTRSTVRRAVAEVALTIYNKGRRSGQLEAL